MTGTIFKLGRLRIALGSVRFEGPNTDDGAIVLHGVVRFEMWDDENQTCCRRWLSVPIRCWIGTDGDLIEWCAAHESAKIVAAALEGGDAYLLRLAHWDLCEGIGEEVCALLREAAGEEV